MILGPFFLVRTGDRLQEASSKGACLVEDPCVHLTHLTDRSFLVRSYGSIPFWGVMGTYVK